MFCFSFLFFLFIAHVCSISRLSVQDLHLVHVFLLLSHCAGISYFHDSVTTSLHLYSNPDTYILKPEYQPYRCLKPRLFWLRFDELPYSNSQMPKLNPCGKQIQTRKRYSEAQPSNIVLGWEPWYLCVLVPNLILAFSEMPSHRAQVLLTPEKQILFNSIVYAIKWIKC